MLVVILMNNSAAVVRSVYQTKDTKDCDYVTIMFLVSDSHRLYWCVLLTFTGVVVHCCANFHFKVSK